VICRSVLTYIHMPPLAADRKTENRPIVIVCSYPSAKPSARSSTIMLLLPAHAPSTIVRSICASYIR